MKKNLTLFLIVSLFFASNVHSMYRFCRSCFHQFQLPLDLEVYEQEEVYEREKVYKQAEVYKGYVGIGTEDYIPHIPTGSKVLDAILPLFFASNVRSTYPFCHSKRSRFHQSPLKKEDYEQRAEGYYERYAGIRAEDFIPPHIPAGSMVLDVGAGDGIITKKIIRMVGEENVWALEPNPDSFKKLVGLLGSNEKYKQITLQEALEKDPQRFKEAFDVVTVIKYNIGLPETDKFIKALAQVVKPNGKVLIMSVERERFVPSSSSKFYIRNRFWRDFKKEFLEEEPYIHRGKVTGKRYGILTLQKIETTANDIPIS